MVDRPEKSQLAPKNVAPPPHSDHPQTCRYRDAPWWKTTAEMIGIGAVIAYTIFSGFQMHYAHQAAQAATDTLKTMKDQFQMDQRPHIAALEYTMIDTETQKAGPPVKGHPFAVTITLKNVGKSTARDVYIHRHVLFGKQYSTIRIESPDTQKVSAVLEAESQILHQARAR